MLLELLPHLARLMPVADKFLATRGTSETAQQAALAAMADGIRSDVGQVAQMHAGVQRALKEQGEQVAAIAVEVTRVRMGMESIETRVAGLEKTRRLMINLLIATVVLLVGSVALLAMVLAHLLGRA